MQYTLRKIPPSLDAALRRRAHEEKKSLNALLVEALTSALGFGSEPAHHRDLSDIAGSWKNDKAFERAIADQHRIDKALWK